MKRLAHYSQHFLRSPRLVKELIGHSTIKKSDLVYDIGAGSGVITSALAGRCRHVVAVEAEPRTAKKLKENMQRFSNVTVQETDILKLRLPDEPYKIFANIPFHLSSKILRRLVEAENSPAAIYLIVQKQFADKLRIGTERFTGVTGAYLAPWYTVRVRKRLQKTDFWPYPNVDTVFIELLPRSEPFLPRDSMGEYGSFIENSFSTPKYFTKLPFDRAGVPKNMKPSQLNEAQWAMLFRMN